MLGLLGSCLPSLFLNEDDFYAAEQCLKAGLHAQVKSCEEWKKEQEAQHENN